MNYKLNSFPKKPINNEELQQLFSYDVSKTGAKNLFL